MQPYSFHNFRQTGRFYQYLYLGEVLTVLHTARLRLEPFATEHLDGLSAMNQIPEVMRYISGQPETLEQTAAAIARVQRCWAAWGTSWWAFIEPSSGRVLELDVSSTRAMTLHYLLT